MKGTQKPDDMVECSQVAIFLHSQPLSPKQEGKGGGTTNTERQRCGCKLEQYF